MKKEEIRYMTRNELQAYIQDELCENEMLLLIYDEDGGGKEESHGGEKAECSTSEIGG